MDYTASTGDLSGLIPETEFRAWSLRASRLMDRLTLGRAEQYAETLAAPLSDACVQIAELMYQQAAARAGSRGGLLASASNDGYSESYTSGASAGALLQAQARDILGSCLGADSYGLLYRGVGPC